jgi:hypothetical protein
MRAREAKPKVRAEQYSQRRREGGEVGRTAIRCIHRKLAEDRKNVGVCVYVM